MRVTNNKIFITRGETGNYTLVVRYYDNNEPFRLVDSTGILDFMALLTVKATAYDSKAMLVSSINIEDTDIPVFTQEAIVPIEDQGELASFDDHTPVAADVGKLFKAKRSSTDNTITYGYAISDGNDGYEWKKDYVFSLTFPFDYEDTSVLEPKKYVYDINLFGGNWDGEQHTIDKFTVTSKQILLEPTEFTVGGSLSG